MQWRGEWITWGLAFVIYASWVGLTWSFHALPVWLVFPLGAYLISWHGSLQHETIHGHPTRIRWVNALVGYAPLGLLIPFSRYRYLHLKHHGVDYLTDPIDDPESFYVTPETWDSLEPISRAWLKFNQTMIGRLVFGPLLCTIQFARSEFREITGRNLACQAAWLVHAVTVSAVLYWVMAVCGISFWQYVFCFAYPGMSLTLMRSYAEHRPADTDGEQSVIVEAAAPLQLLYLANNFHYVHHQNPGLAW
jgi:fatty acid desaturase